MKTNHYRATRASIGMVICSALSFVDVSSLEAAEKTEPAPRAEDSTPTIVDWTPGSAWRQKLKREGMKATASVKVEPPAFRRDKMKVKTKRFERRDPPGKSQPPQSPATPPSPADGKQ